MEKSAPERAAVAFGGFGLLALEECAATGTARGARRAAAVATARSPRYSFTTAMNMSAMCW